MKALIKFNRRFGRCSEEFSQKVEKMLKTTTKKIRGLISKS
jgi:hypothetical protein